MGRVIAPIPITVRPRALTAWHFTDASQGPEFAALTRGEWRPDDPVPGVWFGFPEKHRRLTVGDYLVRDTAANFRVVTTVPFAESYDTVVPEHPASLLAHVRHALAAEFDEAEDVVAVLRRLLRVRHPNDPCGGCAHPRFAHQGFHHEYQACALCDRPGSDCVDYIEN